MTKNTIIIRETGGLYLEIDEKEVEHMFCPNCGKEIQEGAGFCPSCGNKVSGASSDAMKEKFKKAADLLQILQRHLGIR